LEPIASPPVCSSHKVKKTIEEKNMRLASILAAAATLLATLAFALPAQAAVATTDVNVRATPGGTIVGLLRTGERATIVGRSGSWCEVDRPGRDGWVACRYLAEDGRPSGGGTSRPDVSIEFSVPGFSFSIGDGGFDFDRPGRPGLPGRDRVCFYEHVNFEGDSFCARPGERLRALGSWNDRISSIRVRGDVEALVCEHNDFRGRCVVIDRNVRNLGFRGNIISSIRVR
jgi:uncharacterized protein YraI